MARKHTKKKKTAGDDKVKGRFVSMLFREDDDEEIFEDANFIVKKKKVKSALPLMREIFGDALRKYRARLEAAEGQKQAG